MTRDDGSDDLVWMSGGVVPGIAECPAFVMRQTEPSAIPVLIAAPHAGRAYPLILLERLRNPGFAPLRLEDRYVDRIADRVARATGAALLVAQAPRAMIDLNRAPDDVDWDMFGMRAGDRASGAATGKRARSGLGLIPRRLPGIGELWKRRHSEGDLTERIAKIHEPYHARLSAVLNDLRARWGSALLIDLHSMPPLKLAGDQHGPEFVIGDRFGASCDGALISAAFAHFGQQHRSAAHNRPYAGGYVLDRHADPARGIHAFQLEIDRSSYLDQRLAELGPGFAAMVDLLSALVLRLAADVAGLGCNGNVGCWPEAAE